MTANGWVQILLFLALILGDQQNAGRVHGPGFQSANATFA